jgi:hypothetical protein
MTYQAVVQVDNGSALPIQASFASARAPADSRVGGMPQPLPYIKLSRFIRHFGPSYPDEKLLGCMC